MHIEDLTLCRYHSGPYDASEWHSPLLAVGWLESPHSYTTGDAPMEVVLRLERWLDATWDCYSAYAFRGLYKCTFCEAEGCAGYQDERWFRKSHLNYWIPGTSSIFLAPSMITHYMREHAYCPPEEFIAAVLSCPEYGSDAYREALRLANGGEKIPLLTCEELDAEWAAKVELLKAHRANERTS